MLAAIKDLVSVQMIASLGGNVVSFILPYQLEGDVKEPTLLFEKSRRRRPVVWSLSLESNVLT